MKIKLLFIINILTSVAFGQFANKSQLKTVTNEMIAIIKKHSLVKDSTNWDELCKQITKDIDNIQKLDSSDFIISKIFNTLEKYGDNHSHYMHKTFFEDTLLSSNKSIPLPNSKLLDGL